MERMTAGTGSTARLEHTGSGTVRRILVLMLGEASPRIRRQFALAFLLVVAGALLAALTPLKRLVDTIAIAAPVGGTFDVSGAALVACYAAALCGSRVFAELRGLVSGTAEQRLNAALNRRFFGHLLALPLAFHLERQAGAVVHSLYQAAAGCQIIVGTILTTMVPVVVETVAVIAILSQLDQPLLVAIFAGTALGYLAAFGLAARPHRKRARDLSLATLDLHAVLSDNLVNVEMIKGIRCRKWRTGSLCQGRLRPRGLLETPPSPARIRRPSDHGDPGNFRHGHAPGLAQRGFRRHAQRRRLRHDQRLHAADHATAGTGGSRHARSLPGSRIRSPGARCPGATARAMPAAPGFARGRFSARDIQDRHNRRDAFAPPRDPSSPGQLCLRRGSSHIGWSGPPRPAGPVRRDRRCERLRKVNPRTPAALPVPRAVRIHHHRRNASRQDFSSSSCAP
jgi:hypothetical protein